MRVTVNVRPKQTELDGMIKRLENLQPALEPAADALVKLVDDSFLNAQTPWGDAWKPLAESTIRRKGSSRPLVDSGVLKNSITAKAEKLRILLGTNVPYAGFHQFGTPNIPKREFLPVKDGEFPTEGPAGRTLALIKKYILSYIRTGKP